MPKTRTQKIPSLNGLLWVLPMEVPWLCGSAKNTLPNVLAQSVILQPSNLHLTFGPMRSQLKRPIPTIAMSVGTESRVERMNEQLNLQPKIDDLRVDYKDYQHLHHNLLSLFDIPVLFNKVNLGPFSDSCDISDVCQIMTNETGGANGDAERVLQLASMLYTASYGKFKGINNDYKGLVNYLSNINYDEKNLMQASARSYLWQQCSEFGQFMSTDSGRGLFASSVPNDYFIALCSDVFHHSISVETLKTALKNTLDVYGGRSHYYTGTNTLIFHGQTDPWKNLGVNSTKDSSSKVYLTSDVGHAAVLQPPKDTDPYSLKFARKNVLNAQVKKWVKAASNHQKLAIPKKDTKEESKVEPTSPKYPEIKNWEGSIEYAEHPTIHPFKDFKAFVAQRKDKLVADQQPKRRPPGFTDTLRRHMLLNKQDYANNTGHVHNKYLKTGFILQDVDHFDKTNALQYSQRFFSNYQFQRDQNASRFLMLGGEAAIDWEYVEGVTFQYYQWAKDFKAVIQPFDTLSVANLRYLNTEQVLADTAVFVTNMNKAENQTNPRWISGAIASSAPLQAKVDFFEYMQKVESDVKAYGKEGCHSAVRRYFSWIRQKMNTRPGRVQVKAVFCFSNDWHENYADEKMLNILLPQKFMI
uniref:Uncharacterized protein n=1 Tax=Ditylenchus dipsaci TaxID=166011 RepID=A0A915CTK7_9BILA